MNPAPLILVVDDTTCISDIIRHVLQGAGFRTRAARNALEGVALARLERPDLILMDILMPGMDGSMVSGSMKETDELKDIPVVLLSAMPEEEIRRRATDCGAAAFLPKPFRHEELLRCVERVLATSATRKEAS